MQAIRSKDSEAADRELYFGGNVSDGVSLSSVSSVLFGAILSPGGGNRSGFGCAFLNVALVVSNLFYVLELCSQPPKEDGSVDYGSITTVSARSCVCVCVCVCVCSHVIIAR